MDKNITYTKSSDGTHRFVFFWNDTDPNGFLSQWYHADFTVEGITYFSCEQYMMAKKALVFEDAENYIRIMHSTDPAECKALGRAVGTGSGAVPFDKEKWSGAAKEVIFDGNYAKFTQNESIGQLLLSTENAVLAEASPEDRIYGIGLSADDISATDPKLWKGSNFMGLTLMQLREMLAQS